MKIMMWNIRGAASKSTVRTLKELQNQKKPDLTILVETKCSGNKGREVIKAMGFNHAIVEEAVGFVGGIWILWKNDDFKIKVISTHKQFVHMEIENNQRRTWSLTAVYASPQEAQRKEMWELLHNISRNMNLPWLMIDDFNDIAEQSEKKGGGENDAYACRRFRGWIDKCNLIDVGYSGSRFTWKGGIREGQERVYKRLDRALCNSEWRTNFSNAFVEVLPRIQSDHHPLLLHTRPETSIHGERPFKYEAMWNTHEDLPNVIKSAWNNEYDFPVALNNLTESLKKWNNETFGNIFRKKRRLLNRIQGIQKSRLYGRNKFLDGLEKDLSEELKKILDQEEIFWLQKSRQKWLVEGDRNTKYFHTKTLVRRRKNKIVKLRNNNGIWCEEIKAVKSIVSNFFTDLYRDERPKRPTIRCSWQYKRLEEEQKQMLERMPIPSEIEEAIHSIGSLKAPGEDGYPALFFKENWKVLQCSICAFIQKLWQDPPSIQQVNQTLLTLIPKINQPEFVSQFRPIALCNVIYKCLSKILVKRIKPTLNERIAPNQSSFIPSRLIHDNIIIAKEMVHTMGKMKGKNSFMAIKIDFEKAYDRLNWCFLEKCCLEYGMSEKTISIIMQCVSSVSFKILWNGEKLDMFKPSRGLRQGDPLSPYLFVIAMDKLSQLIEETVIKGKWIPMKAGQRGPQISHLLFADDLLLFTEATENQMKVVLETLDEFGAASGFKINAEKTSILFSKNVPNCKRVGIKEICGFQEVPCLGRYLGAYLTNNRKKKEDFKSIIERTKSKLKGWKANCLSLAGRITLAQTVISPMLNFDMLHTKIPIGICNEVEKCQRKFIWGENSNTRKLHAVKWDTLCKTKINGGLGMRKLHIMNDAFFMKQVWRLMHERETLWAKVLFNKYGREKDSILNMENRASDSKFWRDLIKIKEDMKENLRFSIGNGKSTSLWRDKWLYHENALIEDVQEINASLLNMKVADAVLENGEWNLELLRELIPEDKILKITAYHPPKESLGEDKIMWSPSEDRNFTVASAYKTLSQANENQDQTWNLIWKWKGPQRIKCFMWLATQNKLMTSERRQKIFGANPNCHRCPNNPETLLHTLRDCTEASRIWRQLVKPSYITTFYRAPFETWIRWNLTVEIGANAQPWLSQFVVTCWWLWKWRNKEIFDPPFRRPNNAHLWIKEYLQRINNAFEKVNILKGAQKKKEIHIAWQPPEDGWLKINTDGAISQEHHIAGCGGLIRDSRGRWVAGFLVNIGKGTAFTAEAWGILHGLKLAWDLGFKKIILETDSKIAFQILSKREERDNHPETIIRSISQLIQRDWNVKLCHTYREGNKSADWLAKESLQACLGFHFIDTMPTGLRNIIDDDARGVSLPRFIIDF
ncbi:uncharacterized protein [Arachis hypogaea]|uniref:uncharacterized protein n=1 Tax=Arachis hypogaea TaxID=3818 RepID=UPI003B215C5C